jgi:rod shape-determining protein MreD
MGSFPMATLISIPILTFATILQSAVFSKITLLQASADLVLVTTISWMIQERVKVVWQWAIVAGILVGFVSEISMWATVLGYLTTAVLTSTLKRRVWRAPILALFTAIFVGTLVLQMLTYVYLQILGTDFDLFQVFNLILLPSLLLNLLISLPVQGIIREVALWFYPEGIEA